MDVRETLALDKPEDLRQWLQDNHQTKMEIWLIYYKKSSGKQTLTIAQAVDEALCLAGSRADLNRWIHSVSLCAFRHTTRLAAGHSPT